MFNKKTVTPKKVAANRANFKFSTGPRTERGKRAARFNAVKFGFFSDEVVIPSCDGNEAPAKYESLVTHLQEHFQPDGMLETWLVERIAESIWRLRRARRAERGSSLVNAWDASVVPTEGSPMHTVMTSLSGNQCMVALLNTARDEIRRSGTLSEATYKIVGPLVTAEQQTAVTPPQTEEEKQPPETTKTTESKPTIDEDFIRRLEMKKSLLERDAIRLNTAVKEGVENRIAKASLPPASEMDKILRYEKQMQKQLDWALEKLAECRQRRKKFC